MHYACNDKNTGSKLVELHDEKKLNINCLRCPVCHSNWRGNSTRYEKDYIYDDNRFTVEAAKKLWDEINVCKFKKITNDKHCKFVVFNILVDMVGLDGARHICGGDKSITEVATSHKRLIRKVKKLCIYIFLLTLISNFIYVYM